ncbi:MAG: hypothetical protein V5A68_01585, partial [Candidatus Thermoplasmatota archaeon]
MISNKSKSMILIVILFSSFLTFIPSDIMSKEIDWWDENWSYRQQINVPLDTSKEISKKMPIDMNINFENECWAKDPLNHSVRVCVWDGINWVEIESQIYDLKREDEGLINGCNLVFLIPDFTDGEEKYYVYYDDEAKPSIDYIDHVNIEESFYRYEPIPGYPLESYYYKLIDEGYINYAISQKGQFMGYHTGQHITKMKKNTVEVKPKNGQLFAAFDFKYCYDKGIFDYSSTSQKLVSKNIVVDGNLMAEFVIVTKSKLNDLKTSVTYKYYHCPTSDSRIHVHVKHEALKKINIFEKARTDGTYASMQFTAVKSRSIEDLNIGKILPFMSFKNEMNTITEYDIDTDPEYIPEDPDIRLLSIQDDVNLGKQPWFAFNDKKTGEAHCVLFDSKNIVRKGENERDGIQLNAFQMDYPHFPGLENNIATIQVGRNSFENGVQDFVIPCGFIAEFDAEFFSTESRGIDVIKKESDAFKVLNEIKPKYQGTKEYDTREEKDHSLKIRLHLANSMPKGSALSALSGKNFPYLNVELFKDDSFVVSETASRLPMDAIKDLDKLNLAQKIKSVLTSFDWKNMSFFKSVEFNHLNTGKYVVRVYRENPFLKKDREYIGFKTIDIQDDDIKTDVYCGSEGGHNVHVLDQKKDGVVNATILLERNNFTIFKTKTDEKGKASVNAPYSLKPYRLKILYNGDNVYNDYIKLKLISGIRSDEKKVEIERYNFVLKLKDKWGLSPGVTLNPLLKKEIAGKVTFIQPDEKSQGKYIFKNISPDNYQLNIRYKSFNYQKNIEISESKEMKVTVPAEFQINLKTFDDRGISNQPVRVIFERKNKETELKKDGNTLNVNLPPGGYNLKIIDENEEVIANREVFLSNNKRLNIVTKSRPVFTDIIFLFALTFLVFSLFYSYFKKEKKYFMLSLPVSVTLISIFNSWWIIEGSSAMVEFTTKMY